MSQAKMVRFSANSVIFREGEYNVDMYKVINGHVELYTGYGSSTEHLLGLLGSQSCFGELGLLIDKPSIYTAIAYDEVLLLRISENDLEDFMLENQKNIIDILQNMAESMYSMRYQMDLLLTELESGKRSYEDLIRERRLQARQSLKQYAVYNAHMNQASRLSQIPAGGKKS